MSPGTSRKIEKYDFQICIERGHCLMIGVVLAFIILFRLACASCPSVSDMQGLTGKILTREDLYHFISISIYSQ
jgi:hypothetical protein